MFQCKGSRVDFDCKSNYKIALGSFESPAVSWIHVRLNRSKEERPGWDTTTPQRQAPCNLFSVLKHRNEFWIISDSLSKWHNLPGRTFWEDTTSTPTTSRVWRPHLEITPHQGPSQRPPFAEAQGTSQTSSKGLNFAGVGLKQRPRTTRRIPLLGTQFEVPMFPNILQTNIQHLKNNPNHSPQHCWIHLLSL